MKKVKLFKPFILVMILSITSFSFSQNDDEMEIPVLQIDGKDTNVVYTVVEKMPEFPGGEEKLYEFLGKNIKYPKLAKEANVHGRVYAQFVVEKDGSITDVKVVRGIGSGCDKEAIRVINKMPKWSPGEQRGKKVRVKYTLPFRFELRDNFTQKKSKYDVAPAKTEKLKKLEDKLISKSLKKGKGVYGFLPKSVYLDEEGKITEFDFGDKSLSDKQIKKIKKLFNKKGNFIPAKKDGKAVPSEITFN